jgi:arylsulfatase A-like enzyme
VEVLKKTHQLDDTVIVFTSDNGFFYGEHRVPADKVRFYEPSIRVPLMMRGPGIPEDVTRKALVANIDLAPTILALAHATPLRTMDGESLVPMLKKEPPATDRSILLEAGGAPYFPRWGVRTPRWAYWRYDQQLNELYDLRKDPNELHNLIRDPKYAAVVADLDARRKALQACAGASCNLVAAVAEGETAG